MREVLSTVLVRQAAQLLSRVNNERPGPATTHLIRRSKVLFNHLVRAAEQRQWHGEAERFGGLQVDDHLHFRDLHDW